MIEFLVALMTRPEFYQPEIAVRAAYCIHTQAGTDEKSECCGVCVGGKIIHGDGHITDCPCPPDCKCKTVDKAVVQPPVVIEPKAVVRKDCPDGRCRVK
jgi:hypothetical protein